MAKWFEENGHDNDVVLSTRIRLARNLKGIPYPNKMSNEDAEKVISLVETALEEMNYTFTKFDVSNLSDVQKHKLVEQRYISPGFASGKLPCAAYVSEDENISIMVNEEDHIRIQCICSGLCDKEAYDLITKVDTYLRERLDYATHEKYGYLTSCLTNLGTGMRVSYMLHLPALEMSGAIEGVFDAVRKLGVTVRGMYGEGTKSYGSLFQISNQTTLGRSENEIIDALCETLSTVVSKEREMKKILFDKKREVIEDKIMRSYAILKSARIIQSKEMMQRLSDIRFGLALGIIEGLEYRTLGKIMIGASPANMSDMAGSESAFQRDVRRATFIRDAIKEE